MSGCGRPLAKDEWWTFCGETDMGQTAPALCTECGGEFKLKEVANMMDERAVEAGRRAAETIATDKDPGEKHFIYRLVKSAFRILGCVLFIILGFVTNEMLLCYGAGMFFAAEVLGIAEELT